MDILRLFFWFCKEQKIMDLIFKMYYTQPLKRYSLLSLGDNNVVYISLRDFLEDCLRGDCIEDVFWCLQSRTKNINLRDEEEVKRLRKAVKNWKTFCRRNVKYSEDFAKPNDRIAYANYYGAQLKGTIIAMPNRLGGSATVKNDDGRIEYVVLDYHGEIEVNGDKKKPKYFIRKNRKTYGLNKR